MRKIRHLLVILALNFAFCPDGEGMMSLYNSGAILNRITNPNIYSDFELILAEKKGKRIQKLFGNLKLENHFKN